MKRTEWFPISINPVRSGMYEVTCNPRYWTTFFFYHDPLNKWADGAYVNNKLTFTYWRGLEYPDPHDHAGWMKLAGEMKKENSFDEYARLHRLRGMLEKVKENARKVIVAVDKVLDEKYP